MRRSTSAGARATWSHLGDAFHAAVPQFHDIISLFGGPQIRHVGTIGGNLVNASPIADSIPFLMVMDAQLELFGPRGSRLVNINQFYHGYKQLELRADELISEIRIPLPGAEERVRLTKVSRRRDLDISTVTAAIRWTMQEDTIDKIQIALGGVGPVVLRAPQTELFLRGKPLTTDNLTTAGDIAATEVTPISDVRGTATYRYQLIRNLFYPLAQPGRTHA
ncbi:MAG: FAD binding domain-containing protein [Planctomycetota bacterium]